MAIALESYFAEHNCYPAWNVDPNRNVFGKTVLEYPAMAKLPTFSLDSGPHPNTLTTPLAYLPAYFADPYAPFKGATFCYWTKNFSESGPGKSGWILWSPGPDKKYDLTLDNIAQIYDPLKPVPSAALLELTYDPSNGSASTGDIWRPNK
ncbi:MAG TPA: hypothetical protein VHP11_12035 [Tepidisphaeraceae bacterium]|nr:hypothetical protein [Tepidisphaeraceae bacterium]